MGRGAEGVIKGESRGRKSGWGCTNRPNHQEGSTEAGEESQFLRGATGTTSCPGGESVTQRGGGRGGGAHGQTIQEPLPPKWGGRHPLKLKNGTKQKDRKRANPRSHTEPRGREERRGTRGRVTIRRGGGSVTGVGGDTEMNKNDPPSCSCFSEALSLLTYCVVIASARQWSGSRAQLSL